MSADQQMSLTIVGASGSFPGPASPASCYLVQVRDEGRTWNVALDLGNGSLGALQRHIDPNDLDAIVLSHLHPDHCLDVCSLNVMRTYRPGGPPQGRIDIYGPIDTPDRLARAYGVYGPESLTDQFRFHTITDGVPVHIGPVQVTAFLVEHPVEAYGLRVEWNGIVLGYSGDTDLCDGLNRVFHGADLVLADCAFLDGRDAIRGIHMTGSRAAQAALNAQGVRRLMLTHIPVWNDPAICQAQAATVWPGEVEVARPGATYLLP